VIDVDRVLVAGSLEHCAAKFFRVVEVQLCWDSPAWQALAIPRFCRSFSFGRIMVAIH